MRPMQMIGANVKVATHDGDEGLGMMVEGHGITTCWTPTPEEIDNLIAGGYVRVIVDFSGGKISADCIHPFPPDE